MKIRFFGDFHLSESTPRSWKENYLENSFYELELLSRGADYLICLGDFFNTPTVSDNLKNSLTDKLIELKNKYKTKYLTVRGNHDLISYSKHSTLLNKTSLELFDKSTSLLNVITKLIIGEVCIQSIDGYKGWNIPDPVEGKINILLGHQYLDNSLDKNLNLLSEDLVGRGFKYVILGHDHEPHPVKSLPDGTMIFRPGSQSRHTSHLFNLRRKPYYVEYDSSTGKIGEYVLEGSKPSEDLFLEEVYHKSDNSEEKFLENLDDLFLSFKRSSEVQVSVGKVLGELNAPVQVVDYLKEVHIKNNQKWM